mmetsp:Transcript_79715/g.182598  ORF Transcript_79715/g.182598 Transcript_79715/m.182598 type:complete len:264 (-) Transcript_79715:1283-2074(-)
MPPSPLACMIGCRPSHSTGKFSKGFGTPSISSTSNSCRCSRSTTSLLVQTAENPCTCCIPHGHAIISVTNAVAPHSISSSSPCCSPTTPDRASREASTKSVDPTDNCCSQISWAASIQDGGPPRWDTEIPTAWNPLGHSTSRVVPLGHSDMRWVRSWSRISSHAPPLGLVRFSAVAFGSAASSAVSNRPSEAAPRARAKYTFPESSSSPSASWYTTGPTSSTPWARCVVTTPSAATVIPTCSSSGVGAARRRMPPDTSGSTMI